MITFKISATIEIDPDRGLTFSKPVEYSLPNNFFVNISNNIDEENKFNIQLIVLAPTSEQANYVANDELLKIVNVLSWEYSLSIKRFAITGQQYLIQEGDQDILVMSDTLLINDHVTISLGLEQEGIKALSDSLISYNSNDAKFDEIIMMWREALSADSKGLQFMLFFRLLEHLMGNTKEARRKADTYIQSQMPAIERREGIKGEVISVFTYLRDNIHAKNPEFPFKEIENQLPSLMALVRTAILSFFADRQL